MNRNNSESTILLISRLCRFIDSNETNLHAMIVYSTCFGLIPELETDVVLENEELLKKFSAYNTYEFNFNIRTIRPTPHQDRLIRTTIFELLAMPYWEPRWLGIQNTDNEQFTKFLAEIFKVLNKRDVQYEAILQLRNRLIEQGVETYNFKKIKLGVLVDLMRGLYSRDQKVQHFISPEVTFHLDKGLNKEIAASICNEVALVARTHTQYKLDISEKIAEQAHLLNTLNKENIQKAVDALADAYTYVASRGSLNPFKSE